MTPWRSTRKSHGPSSSALDRPSRIASLPSNIWDLQVEQAIFLGLMRMREKIARAFPSSSSSQLSSGRRRSATNAIAGIAEDGGGRTGERRNVGTYTRSFWKSLGAGGAKGGQGQGSSGGQGAALGQIYWGGDGNHRPRVVAFAETLRAGESALSPEVFDVTGGRRAEVRKGGRCYIVVDVQRINPFSGLLCESTASWHCVIEFLGCFLLLFYVVGVPGSGTRPDST